MTRLAALFLALAQMLASSPAMAQIYTSIQSDSVIACPGDGTDTQPDFDSLPCTATNFWDVDPQDSEVWIRGVIRVSADQLAHDGPLGLYVSAMASSEVWVNDQRIGQNGQPAANRVDETPGLMDAVLYLPHSLMRAGENEIVVRYSDHHGFLTVGNPLHVLAIGPYTDPTTTVMASYKWSMVTLGAFLLGFIVFGVSAVRGEDRVGSALLSALSFMAGAQLLVEAGRGLIAYAYPLHDVRLVLIVACSTAFGLLLVAYLLHRFSALSRRQQLIRLLGVLALQLSVIAIQIGYDAKAGFSFLAACVAGIVWCAVWTRQKKPGALTFLGILAGFTALLLYFAGRFLDVYFFYAVTGLLLFLFWQQAIALIRARRAKRHEEARAAQLEVALAQARQKSAPDQIQLVSSGRVDYVSTDSIVQLKGAGDYVEVHFESGTTSLYTGGLTQLEADLPPTFLRVHRSHIVNTAFVSALERDVSGVGRLMLSNGTEAPVSRRIMPKVRSALAAA